MVASNRTEVRPANVRGALVLGALLAAIVAIAMAISFRIYTQLDSTIAVERGLVASQRQIDIAVQQQLNLETGLRGYLATNQVSFFQQPYDQGHEEYYKAIEALALASRGVGISDLPIAEMQSLHSAWEHQVALPLLKNPHSKDRKTRLELGKVLDDQLQGDTQRVLDTLRDRLAIVQDELKRRINEALFAGLASVIVFGSVGILFVGSRQQMLAVIDRERSIVETLQGAFSTDLDSLPGSHIGTAYISADKDAAVGGDLYDVRRLDERRGLIVVADVSGKGIGAAVNTAFVKYSIRMLARTEPDPAEILAQFNTVFIETVKDPNLFVVVFVGILDTQARVLEYASAGHGGAYLRSGEHVGRLEVTGPIIGLDKAFGYESRSLALAPGDLVLLATDGLTEARDGTGALLDDDGAMALLKAAPSEPQACADELVEAIRLRSGGMLHDDLALVVLAIDATAAA